MFPAGIGAFALLPAVLAILHFPNARVLRTRKLRKLPQKWSNLAVFLGPETTARGVLGRPPFGPRKQGSRGVCLCPVLGCRFVCRGGLLGRQMAGFWARWKPFLGAQRPFALRRFMKKCRCWYAPCFKAFVPSPRAQVCSQIALTHQT